MNRRTLEALIRGGAFDSIEPNRAMLLANIDLAMNTPTKKPPTPIRADFST